MTYYAIYNKYGIRTAGVREELYMFTSKQARDEWVSNNYLDCNSNVVAEAVSRKEAIRRVGKNVSTVSNNPKGGTKNG